MKTSKLFLLNIADFGKGLFIAGITASLTALSQMLTSVPPVLDYKQIGLTAFTAMVAYLIKQLSTNSNNELLRSEIGAGTVGTSGPKKGK
jgi:hypothetical protein